MKKLNTSTKPWGKGGRGAERRSGEVDDDEEVEALALGFADVLEDIFRGPGERVAPETVFEGPLVGEPVAGIGEVRRGKPVAPVRSCGAVDGGAFAPDDAADALLEEEAQRLDQCAAVAPSPNFSLERR